MPTLLQREGLLPGTDRQFAAAQQDAGNGRKNGRSIDAAGTGAPDPSWTPSAHYGNRDRLSHRGRPAFNGSRAGLVDGPVQGSHDSICHI